MGLIYLEDVDAVKMDVKHVVSFHIIDNSTANFANPISFGILITYRYDRLYGQQIVFGNTGMFQRVYSGGSWGVWGNYKDL